MAKVILVRHGQTDWNETLLIQGGGSDTELNKRGRMQAESLGLRLKQEKIDAIYSSPLKRALKTAKTIAYHHQLEVQIEPALREVDAARLEGTPVSDIGARLEQVLTGQRRVEELFQAYGGESLDELQERAWGAIKRLVTSHLDERIVVVCHYFVILTILCAVLDIPLSRIIRFRLSEGSISIIVLDGKAPHLVLLNDISHLKNP